MGPSNYKVGDLVWLEGKYFYDPEQEFKQKLNARRFGPFLILELIGRSAVWLNILHTMRIYPVVHVEHTGTTIKHPSDIHNQSLKNTMRLRRSWVIT